MTQTITRRHGDEVIRLPWDQVINVFAYKRDLYAYDEICFVIESPYCRIEVREGVEGYAGLIPYMENHIPGFPTEKDWWEAVVLPPFEQNWTKIYSRGISTRQTEN